MMRARMVGRSLLVLIALLIGGWAMIAGAAEAEGWWVPESRAAMLAASARSGKPIWLVISTPSCGWCEYLKDSVNQSPVLRLLADEMAIRVCADVSTPTGRGLVEGLFWQGTPHAFLLDAEGAVLAANRGAFYLPLHWLSWLEEGGASIDPVSALARVRQQGPQEQLPVIDRMALGWLYTKNGDSAALLRDCGADLLPLLSSPEMCLFAAELWMQAGQEGTALALETLRELARQQPQPYQKTLARLYESVGKNH